MSFNPLGKHLHLFYMYETYFILLIKPFTTRGSHDASNQADEHNQL